MGDDDRIILKYFFKTLFMGSDPVRENILINKSSLILKIYTFCTTCDLEFHAKNDQYNLPSNLIDFI